MLVVIVIAVMLLRAATCRYHLQLCKKKYSSLSTLAGLSVMEEEEHQLLTVLTVPAAVLYIQNEC